MPICSKETAADHRPQREKTDCVLKTKNKTCNCQIKFGFFFFLLGVEVNASVVEFSETTRRYLKTMNIHIIMSLCHFCDYYVIIISHSYVASMRSQTNYKICLGYASFVWNVECLLSLWFCSCGRFFGAYCSGVNRSSKGGDDLRTNARERSDRAGEGVGGGCPPPS